MNRLTILPDMTVVDLGVGTGHYADLFSKQLPNGRIMALEPEESLISWREERKKKDSLDNVSIHKTEEDLKITTADPYFV